MQEFDRLSALRAQQPARSMPMLQPLVPSAATGSAHAGSSSGAGSSAGNQGGQGKRFRPQPIMVPENQSQPCLVLAKAQPLQLGSSGGAGAGAASSSAPPAGQNHHASQQPVAQHPPLQLHPNNTLSQQHGGGALGALGGQGLTDAQAEERRRGSLNGGPSTSGQNSDGAMVNMLGMASPSAALFGSFGGDGLLTSRPLGFDLNTPDSEFKGMELDWPTASPRCAQLACTGLRDVASGAVMRRAQAGSASGAAHTKPN